MAKLSHLQLINSQLFDISNRTPLKYSVLDKRLGICELSSECDTCKGNVQNCPGHFGHVELELPVYHLGYITFVLKILQSICKNCSQCLLLPNHKEYYIRRFRDKTMDMLRKKELLKKLYLECQKISLCPYCNAFNGKVRKVAPWKIIHDMYSYKNKESDAFYSHFEDIKNTTPDIKDYISRCQDTINPLRCLQLFKQIPNEDCELLLIDPNRFRPEFLLLTYVLVPPVCIRPSVPSLIGGSNEDDLTMTMKEIISINTRLKQVMEKGNNLAMVLQEWDHLQYTCGMYFMGDITGLAKFQQTQKSIRALTTRLKGKHGRFRGNLLGKRAEFTARTVISPDPNIGIDEVVIPEKVAKVLSFPERVNKHNIDQLRKRIINGQKVHPGANRVISKNGDHIYYLASNNFQREKIAKDLHYGMIVERHVMDGDVVLFNRQPSLHRLSIMAHFVRVMPWRTFRFNECVCGPYNADFDGDEMNIHVPQTEEAKAEAFTLMTTKHNLITPRNGEPVIAAIQDFITASYLLSRKEVFLDRSQFVQLCQYFSEGVDVPPPSILKPMRLWTGKQIFNCLFKPKNDSPIFINLKVQGKTKPFVSMKQKKFMCLKDSYVVIRNSELLCGLMDKTLVGGNKESVFHVLLRDYGPDICADRMNRLAKLCSRYLSDRGFSIGISDVIPGKILFGSKESLVEKGYLDCDLLIKDYLKSNINDSVGLFKLKALEAKLNGTLSAIRKDVGDLCLKELPRYNSPMIMAICGSKGSDINISQMVGCVGQQTVNGTRIPNGFEDRSLPHFQRNSLSPAAKGFVQNSFFTGLNPTEFFFHTMGGREGLVDTAVKTAETGYMQRRLIKALEDLCVMYDNSVRNCLGEIVQFRYGDDGLDPTNMEGKDQPCDFKRIFMHAKNTTNRKNNKEPSLSTRDIMKHTIALVSSNKSSSELFKKRIIEFVQKKVSKMNNLNGDESEQNRIERKDINLFERKKKITISHLEEFIRFSMKKYECSKVEPGTAVGALAAQSIGEPGTQMTLKTFHFAGVASMNITLGVPRLKEIINATRNINTPIITAELGLYLTMLKSNQQCQLRITEYIEQTICPKLCYITIKLDSQRIHLLKLNINVQSIITSLLSSKSKLKIHPQSIQAMTDDCIRLYASESSECNILYRLQFLKRKLPHVLISGFSGISRAVINDRGKKNSAQGNRYNLLVEGLDLRPVMTTKGVDGYKTESNHIMEMAEVIGIECARDTIIDQIQYTMSEHGMQIDPRHTMLLADLMTCKGKVLGITRFGIGKMKDSVLMLASFERTADVLFDSARHGMSDTIDGVSECIILGMPINIGTGLFKLLREHKKQTFTTRPLLFDTPELYLPLNV